MESMNHEEVRKKLAELTNEYWDGGKGVETLSIGNSMYFFLTRSTLTFWHDVVVTFNISNIKSIDTSEEGFQITDDRMNRIYIAWKLLQRKVV